MGELLDFGPIEDLMQNIIKVIGVGGGGCNAVSRMYKEGIQGCRSLCAIRIVHR